MDPGRLRSFRLLTSQFPSSHLAELFVFFIADHYYHSFVFVLCRIGYDNRDIHIPTGPEGLGQVTKAVLDRIVLIQKGLTDSPWSVIASE